MISSEVEPAVTIQVVQAKRQEKEGNPPGQLRLIFDEKHLEDGHCLSDNNGRRDASALLVLRCHSGMQIFVRTLTGKIITFWKWKRQTPLRWRKEKSKREKESLWIGNVLSLTGNNWKKAVNSATRLSEKFNSSLGFTT